MREGSWLLHVVMSGGVAAQKVHVKEDLGKAPRLRGLFGLTVHVKKVLDQGPRP